MIKQPSTLGTILSSKSSGRSNLHFVEIIYFSSYPAIRDKTTSFGSNCSSFTTENPEILFFTSSSKLSHSVLPAYSKNFKNARLASWVLTAFLKKLWHYILFFRLQLFFPFPHDRYVKIICLHKLFCNAAKTFLRVAKKEPKVAVISRNINCHNIQINRRTKLVFLK